MKRLCSEFDHDFGGVANQVFDGASKGVPPTPITLDGGETSMAQFTAHHLIPGNEAWPKSKLYRWIDKRKGHIKGDIGYDVNNERNGVDLPKEALEKSVPMLNFIPPEEWSG